MSNNQSTLDQSDQQPDSSAQPSKLKSRRRGLATGSIRLLIVLQLLLVTTIVGSVIYLSNALRTETLTNMQNHLHVQTQNLEDRLTQSFDLLRIHLDGLVVEHPSAQDDPLFLHDALVSLQRKLPYIRSLSLMDDTGQIRLSTQSANVGQIVPLSGLLPRVAADTPNLLRFGEPWIGRDFSEGQPFSAESAEEFNGLSFFPVTMVLPELSEWTVLLAISSDYFVNLASLQSGDIGMSHRLYKDDGTLLFSTIGDDRPGSSVPDHAALSDILFQHKGEATWENEQGNPQLMAFRTSSRYPWFVFSQICYTDVLKAWSQGTKNLWLLTIPVLVVMLLVTSTLTYRVRRSLQREEQFLEENRQAAIVFSHSSDLITILDQEGRVLAVNPAFETQTGFTESECLGNTLKSFMANYQQLKQSVDKSKKWEGEVSVPRKDGSLITGWLVVTAIKNQAGQISNYVTVFRDLSQIRASEATIKKLSQAVEQSPSSIVITSPEAIIEYANPEFFRASGYDEDEVIGFNPNILQSGLTPVQTYKDLWSNITKGKVWEGTFINKRKDGSIFYERSIVSPLFDEDGKNSGYLGIKHDVSSEIEADRTMRLAVNVIQNTLEGVMICDADERIIEVNPAFTHITGYERDEVLGQHPEMLSSGARNHEVRQEMNAALHELGYWQGEFWNRHKNGTTYAISGSISVIYDNNNKAANYISVFSDVTEQKIQQQTLEQRAHFDLLTGLSNRALLYERLRQAIVSADSDGHWFGLCFMDLDHFKAVNDNHGHDAGDDLLVIVAQRLKECVRPSNVVARLGGDEFVVILNHLTDVDEAQIIAERILARVRAPITVADHVVYVSGSMGITVYPLDDNDVEALMQHADAAMYAAKKAGRDRYQLAAETVAAMQVKDKE